MNFRIFMSTLLLLATIEFGLTGAWSFQPIAAQETPSASSMSDVAKLLFEGEQQLDRSWSEAEQTVFLASDLAGGLSDDDALIVANSQLTVIHAGNTASLEYIHKRNPLHLMLGLHADPDLLVLLRLSQLRWAEVAEHQGRIIEEALKDLDLALDQGADPVLLDYAFATSAIAKTKWFGGDLGTAGLAQLVSELEQRQRNRPQAKSELALKFLEYRMALDSDQFLASRQLQEAADLAVLQSNHALTSFLYRLLASEQVQVRNFIGYNDFLDRAKIAAKTLGNQLETVRGLKGDLSIRMYRERSWEAAKTTFDELYANPVFLTSDRDFQESVFEAAIEIYHHLGDARNEARFAARKYTAQEAEQATRQRHEREAQVVSGIHARRQTEVSRTDQQQRLQQIAWYAVIVSGLALILVLWIWLLRSRAREWKALQALEKEKKIVDENQKEVADLNLKLARLRRMESLGLMAGSIAHDFNNILVGIGGNAELLELAFQYGTFNEEFGTERVAAIRKASDRASKLAKQMLDYAGKQYIAQKPRDLNQIVRDNESVLQSFSRDHHQIRIETAADPLIAEVDDTQIEQVMFNLITNAINASPAGSTITVRTRPTVIDDEATHGCFGARHVGGRFCCLEIEDHGQGIPQSELDRIFEPYYTNSEKGRGLGLAVVYGIVVSHNGLIRCHSTINQGTRFEILLPQSDLACTAPDAPAGLIDSHQADAVFRDKKILIIDDEVSVLETCQQLLQQSGVSTTIAAGGLEGMAAIDRAELTGGFDCVLMDVVMPDMNASEILSQLESRSSQLPVVLMSGFSSDRLDMFHQRKNVVEIVPKPFGLNDLKRALWSALTVREKPAAAAGPKFAKRIAPRSASTLGPTTES